MSEKRMTPHERAKEVVAKCLGDAVPILATRIAAAIQAATKDLETLFAQQAKRADEVRDEYAQYREQNRVLLASMDKIFQSLVSERDGLVGSLEEAMRRLEDGIRSFSELDGIEQQVASMKSDLCDPIAQADRILRIKAEGAASAEAERDAAVKRADEAEVKLAVCNETLRPFANAYDECCTEGETAMNHGCDHPMNHDDAMWEVPVQAIRMARAHFDADAKFSPKAVLHEMLHERMEAFLQVIETDKRLAAAIAREAEMRRALRDIHGLATRELAEPTNNDTAVLLSICTAVEAALPVGGDHERI